MTADLKKPSQLIRTGDLVAAQRELIGILRADPANEAAWFLLVKALPAMPDKIAALRACVKSNPNNQRARKALENLQIQWAAVTRPPRFPEHPDPDNLPPPPSPQPEPAAPQPVRRPIWRWLGAAVVLLVALVILAALIFLSGRGGG
ncbi:MAG: hypothetical protein HPY59_15640 [Anaerolineae bacterium]|nr:hypothetical protein [Anaerolineae bacterium]